jgi:hypothetical protein
VTSLERRRFDHFATELSVALELRVPRHALWIACARQLASGDALARFCGAGLGEFLAAQGLPALACVKGSALARAVARFDPARRSPEEVFGALFLGRS